MPRKVCCGLTCIVQTFATWFWALCCAHVRHQHREPERKGVGDWEPLSVTFLKVYRYFQIRLMLHPSVPSLRIRLLKSVGFVCTTVELYSLEEMFTHRISVMLYLWFAISFLEKTQRSCKFVHRRHRGWRKNYVKRRNNVWMPRLQSIWSITLLGWNLIKIKLLRSQMKIWK